MQSGFNGTKLCNQMLEKEMAIFFLLMALVMMPFGAVSLLGNACSLTLILDLTVVVNLILLVFFFFSSIALLYCNVA